MLEFLDNNVASIQRFNLKRLQLPRDSKIVVFLRILGNFYEHLFWRTSANDCFCFCGLGAVSVFLSFFVFFECKFDFLKIFRSFQKQPPDYSMKKGVQTNVPKFLCCYSCRPKACNFIKKETVTQVFSCEFCENFKKTFLTENLRVTVL